MFRRILIANRGEIAVRVIHACRELGISAAAVYSDADADAVHVRLADCAQRLGPPEAGESYLRGDLVLAAARAMECDAVHPGYGFLSENADFAQAVLDVGLAWIGPPPDAMRRMGRKVEARKVATTAGAQVVPGFDSSDDVEAIADAAGAIGYPLLVKASAGGGGKGMRLVRAAEELHDALSGARREAQHAFGEDRIYLEKYIERPRHIEVQLLADAHGNVLALGERECSIQRRHQKLVEETPSVALNDGQRQALFDSAVGIAREVGYIGAGTIEFILAPDGSLYFLEMNTRLQVEHPVTELVWGLDLVQWQIRIAQGESFVGTLLAESGSGTRWAPSNVGDEPSPVRSADAANCVPTRRGHSVEVRICAEDPAQNFLPQVGRVELLRLPQAPGVRFDHALREGLEVSPYYDPLLGKLIAWAATRELATARLRDALRELRILGVPTNISFLQDVLGHPAFVAGELHTGFIGEHLADWHALELDALARSVGTQLAASGTGLRWAPSNVGDESSPLPTADSASSVPTVWQSLSGWSNI